MLNVQVYVQVGCNFVVHKQNAKLAGKQQTRGGMNLLSSKYYGFVFARRAPGI